MDQKQPRSTQRASYQASMASPSTNIGSDDFEIVSSPPSSDMSWLLKGETLKYHEPDAVIVTSRGKIHGDTFISNYRLKFVPHTGDSQFDFPLGLINAIKKFGYSRNVVNRGDNDYGIKISCKDFRTLKFLHQRERKNRAPLFDILCSNAFPSTSSLPFFAEQYRETFEANGWTLFDPIKEFRRMGVPNQFWGIFVNDDYGFISTYPRILAFPQEALDRGEEFLQTVAKYRSSRRIPALSWHNPKTLASITRSSQPMSGLTWKSCSEDEQYLEIICKANPEAEKLKIFDARPITNAHANRLRGGGYEISYPKCKLIFLNIHSIHAVRKSMKKFKNQCYPKRNPEKFLAGAEDCNWIRHLQAIMDGTHAIVTEICDVHSNVLVHCSDGWDRTSQLTSLTMLLVDPEYRTLEGFMILIEKEWCSFGHKFAIRFGHGVDKPKSEERAPIFIQWLDCIWQYYNHFPTAFQFNMDLIMMLIDEVYSCRFGTFLFNNEREREEAKVKTTTVSIWSYVLDNRARFTNPQYQRINDPLRTITPLKVKIWINYYCRHNADAFQNGSSSASETSIKPHRPAPPPPVKEEMVTKV